MDEDEQEANPAPGDEGALVAQDAPDPDEGADDEIEKLLGLAPEGGEPEPVEIEYEGKTYKLAPELKDALLRQKDYTQKTMTLAEQRKAVEAEETRVRETSELAQEARVRLVHGAALRVRLQELEGTSVEGMSEAQKAQLIMQHQALSNQADQLEREAQEITQKEAATRTERFSKARDTALSEAKAKIPNFDNRKTQIAEYLTSRGEDPENVFGTIENPLIWQVLEDADLGWRYRNRQRKVDAIESAQQAQPATNVRGRKAGAAKDPNKMSPEEYHAMRLKQRAG